MAGSCCGSGGRGYSGRTVPCARCQATSRLRLWIGWPATVGRVRGFLEGGGSRGGGGGLQPPPPLSPGGAEFLEAPKESFVRNELAPPE